MIMLRTWLSNLRMKLAGSKHRAKTIACKPRSICPGLENLEPRQMLAADVNAAFVASAYHMLLNRAPTVGDIAYWSAQDQSNGPQSVLSTIAATPEHQTVEVNNLYDTILGRQANPGEVNYWANLMQSGTSADAVAADILGSDEFFQHAGNSTPAFLTSLYQNNLGRTPDAGGLSYWESLLSQGTSRSDVAQQILSSPESLTKDVQGAYSLYLGRSADPGSVSYWSDQVAAVPGNSASDVLLAGLVGSGEGLSKLNSFTGSSALSSTTDPNVVASAYLNNAFNRSWQLPTTDSALVGWSSTGYDPWLPSTYYQTPAGGTNWSSYVGAGSIDDSAFWASIGAGYDTSTPQRPVGFTNDTAGYQTTASTASSVTNYADGYRIRIFPGQYLPSNDGSSWTGNSFSTGGTATGGGSSAGNGYLTFDENAPKGANLSSTPGYNSWDLFGGTDLLGGQQVSSSANTWNINGGYDMVGGQQVPYSANTWDFNGGYDMVGGQQVPYTTNTFDPYGGTDPYSDYNSYDYYSY
jgi:Domain of unknown function (DUF4214)